MTLYEFIIKDKEGNQLGVIDTAHDRSFSIYLNKAGDARFSLAVEDPKVHRDWLGLGYHELHIYRAGTLVWGGELAYARADAGNEEQTYQITAKGFLDLFSKRIVGTATTPVTYTDTDLVAIATDLVTDTQAQANGDFGITLGLAPASRDADRTEYYYENLLDALLGLSNDRVEDGIDFEVTPDKKFNCYYPAKGRLLDGVVFELGVNVVSYFVIDDATDLVNRVTALGAGEGNGMATATADAASHLQESYRLREGVSSHKSVSNPTTLATHAERELSANQEPRRIVGVTTRGDLPPAFGAYAVGDYVRVKIQQGLISIDDYYRIHGIDVQISEEDAETITLIFNKD